MKKIINMIKGYSKRRKEMEKLLKKMMDSNESGTDSSMTAYWYGKEEITAERLNEQLETMRRNIEVMNQSQTCSDEQVMFRGVIVIEAYNINNVSARKLAGQYEYNPNEVMS